MVDFGKRGVVELRGWRYVFQVLEQIGDGTAFVIVHEGFVEFIIRII